MVRTEIFGSGDASDILRPFVLASEIEGKVDDSMIDGIRDKITEAGFEVLATVSPTSSSHVIVATNPQLKKNAADSKHGAFGAVVRVSVTQEGEKVQVAYTNPRYMANAYRMSGELLEVCDALDNALGFVKAYGSNKGLAAKKLRKYHYKLGMPYFTDPMKLASFKTHEEALEAVERGLKATVGGVHKVYSIDLEGKKESVFGVRFTDGKYTDQYIMSEIDFQDIKSSAHLPYEFIVTDGVVYALSAKFRIAISFPDLSMMGKHSFAGIMGCPRFIQKRLKGVATGKVEEGADDDDAEEEDA